MAYRPYSMRPPRTNNNNNNDDNGSTLTFLRKLQLHAQNSPQSVGFLTLLISSSILLLLTGLIVTATMLGLLFLSPLLIITSPIWVPVGFVLFLVFGGFLLFCGFAVAVLTVVSLLYRYFKGRSKMGDAAGQLKDSARDYVGYLQSRIKDTAPGA